MAKSVEELRVYQKSLQASAEISAIILRESFNRDPRLRDQLVSHAACRRAGSSPHYRSRASSGLGKLEEVAKMLTRLIDHLEADDRKHRR
ncbi:MAG TPA: hypothetical protein VGJ29_00545 [Vicinamibacterales bacterium]|jgi:hypothetical protein